MQPNNQLDAEDLAPDPSDPVQGLDDAGGFHIEELGVEAQPSEEAQADLDAAIDEDSREEGGDEAEREGRKDVGDLYGVHQPAATEPAIDPSIESQTDTGENWIEAMEEDATENGPAPEHILDVTDDSDVDHPTHHKSDHRDRPVADKGSGGPGGL